MTTPPFKVKAVYEYTSAHDDDLNFPLGQVITVTEKEDDEWYIGEYTDVTGVKKDGLFPKNFVEKFEPEAPPRPSRTRPKKEAPPAEPEAATALSEARDTEEPPQALSKPPDAVAVKEEPASVVTSSPKAEQVTAAAPEPPKPVAASKPPPPPVAEKSSSFKDRIAAFNKGSQAPVVPVKPAGAPSASSFIKKPFVAPPPSRDSYVPPPRKDPPAKVYRREEDPDIAEQKAQDAEQAEKAGLANTDPTAEGEEHIKATSLKDRIALLQKQQQEQAERHAEAAAEKSKRPVKRRTEAEETVQPAEIVEEGNVESSFNPEPPARQSIDSFREASKPPAVRRSSREPRSGDQSRDMLSSDNDADQSGAGDTTEDVGGESTEVEDEPNIKPPTRTSTTGTATQTTRPLSGDDENQESEKEVDNDEEEEEDPEVRRKRELRERMAKMSGGMGMGNLFGPPGGTSAGSAKRPKAVPSTSPEERSPPPPPQRIPIMPMPGVQRDGSQDQHDATVEKEQEPGLPVTGKHPPEEVPDVEDLEPHAAEETSRTAALPAPQERPVPSAPSVPPRGAAPPVPGSRPVPPPPETRAVPPVPPRTDTAAADSASEDEDTEDTSIPPQPSGRDLPTRAPPPPAPQGPRSPPPPPRRSTDLMAEGGSPSSLSPTSSQPRRVPPVPGMAPTMPPPTETRPPPPPPPTAAPPKLAVRDSTAGANEDAAEGNGDSDYVYEGDYDTDIASATPKKDALKHVREPSFDDGTFSEDAPSPMQTPAPPPPATRAAPPPPPHQAPKSSRQSTEVSRPTPPAPPIRQPLGNPGDEDYDPYRYDTAPPPPGSLLQESDPELYKAASPPMPNTRAVPPPPVSPPQQKHTAPPPPPPQHQTLPPPVDMRPSREMSRKSAEAPRASLNPSRRSLDQPRTSGDFSEQIAQDVDLEPSTLWWTQPEAPPPIFQNRSDILFESEESSTSKRGGRTTISRDVYVLFQDYSQTIATAQFDPRNPSDVNLEQRHEAPPPRHRQEQLEEAHVQYGSAIAKAADSAQNNSVGNGSAQALIVELVKSQKSALLPIGNRAYGALVYSNMANATVSQHDEIRPGDIVSFRNAKFQGKAGALHKNYSMEVGKPDHVAIVKEWDGTKKKIRALEQGRDREKKGVREESFRVGDLRSGEVKVWRVVGRSWVGWES